MIICSGTDECFEIKYSGYDTNFQHFHKVERIENECCWGIEMCPACRKYNYFHPLLYMLVNLTSKFCFFLCF